jgi:hypothetical protein
VVAAARQSEVALFEAARIDARNADERRHLQDDATAVVPLPFAAERLSASRDGTLALATGAAGLAFIDAAGAARTPETPPHNLEAAVAAVPLDFPGSGLDLIVALFPGGAISAVRSPEAPRILKVETISPDVRFETETAVRVPDGGSKDNTAAVRVPEKKSPTSAPAPESAAAPIAVPVPGPTASTPQPAAEPEGPGTPQPPGTTAPVPGADASPAEDHPVLSGHISGAHQKAHQVALYGPNNILKEYRRAPVDAQGSWSLPLPPPGTYRVILIGDGSNPLPVVPGFRTITVKDGTGQQGLDFEMR